MRGYGQVDEDLDEYEDDFVEDQYEDVGADRYGSEDEEEEEEEEETIPEEKLRYLDLRQKLKEEARSKLRKENGVRSHDRRDAFSLGKFGSFFGPSKPVIADRVIQESKSFLETRHLAPKQSAVHNDEKKVTMSSTSKPQSGGSDRPIYNQVKSKAQVIKQTRDFYSSLLSDDAEIPTPGGDAGPQKNIAPKTDARSAQVSAKSSQPSSGASRKGLNGYEQRKQPSGLNGYEQRKQSSGSNGYEQRKQSSGSNGYEQRKPSSGLNGYEQRRPSSEKLPPRAGQSSRPQASVSGVRHSLAASDSKRQLDLRKQPQSSKQPSSSNGSGPARSAVPKVLPPKKPVPSCDRKAPAAVMERKASIPAGVKTSTVAKNPVANGQRLPPVRPQASVIRNSLGDKRDIQHSREGKMLMENVSASKFPSGRAPKQEAARSTLSKDRYIKEQRPSAKPSVQKSSASKDPYSRKRRAEDAFPDEDVDYRSLIRGMFGRPRHYEDIDDDDDDMCMEVGFDAIQREEIRSAKIAKKEDDEELIKIMEEERREKLRKQAKLRKNQR